MKTISNQNKKFNLAYKDVKKSLQCQLQTVDFPKEDLPADDYVSRILQSQPPLPPIQWKNLLSEIQWVSAIALTITPILAIYGMFTTQLQLKTFIWAAIYYFITGLGITAGEY